MASHWRWFLRLARIVATGVVLAIVVLEIQLTLGFRLADTPLFRYPWPTVGLIVAALAFAAYNIWTTTTGAWASVGIAAFVVAVMPFNALLEPSPPPIPVDFWTGGGALRIERTMTVERSYPIVLVLNGPKDISGKTTAPTNPPTGAGGPSEIAPRARHRGEDAGRCGGEGQYLSAFDLHHGAAPDMVRGRPPMGHRPGFGALAASGAFARGAGSVTLLP